MTLTVIFHSLYVLSSPVEIVETDHNLTKRDDGVVLSTTHAAICREEWGHPPIEDCQPIIEDVKAAAASHTNNFYIWHPDYAGDSQYILRCGVPRSGPLGMRKTRNTSVPSHIRRADGCL